MFAHSKQHKKGTQKATQSATGGLKPNHPNLELFRSFGPNLSKTSAERPYHYERQYAPAGMVKI